MTEPYLIDIPVKRDPLGDLYFAEGEERIPFPIRRVYYVCDIPAHAHRGGHAHREVTEVVMAIRGRFVMDLELQDGTKSQFVLDTPGRGLFLPNLCWREIGQYDEGSFCLVLASGRYDEREYLRNYDDFKAYRPPSA